MKSLTNKNRKNLEFLIKKYRVLAKNKQSLLRVITEAELAESVYNSNAIENSTMTLSQTEQVLLTQETQSSLDLREVYEAKNLQHVIEYLNSYTGGLSIEFILLLHKILLTNIDNTIAGRFREDDEYVRVGKHIAPAPEFIDEQMGHAIVTYEQDISDFIHAISVFHLDFERIHPFVDGNGRIGRVLLNFQLAKLGLPPIILRDRNKHSDYYPVFSAYIDDSDSSLMQQVLYLNLSESLHKRIAYLEGKEIVSLAEYAKQQDKSVRSLQNAARRQTIPAFRIDNTWSIGVDTKR